MDPMSTENVDLVASYKTPEESHNNVDDRESNSLNNIGSINKNNDNMMTIAEADDPTPSTLTWTKWNDPDYENFSDWTIIVNVKKGTESAPQVEEKEGSDEDNDEERSETETPHSEATTTTATYFVHKAVVAVGARSSHYFRRLFTTTSTSRNQRHGPTTVAHGRNETTTNGNGGEIPAETTSTTTPTRIITTQIPVDSSWNIRPHEPFLLC
jgi:hypothetical protein